MKSKSIFHHSLSWSSIVLISLSSVSPLAATPSAVPSGDKEIASFLTLEINMDQRESGLDLKVKMEDGVAILTGTASSLGQVERAANSAICTEGVRAVVNQVTIKSSSGMERNASKVLAAQRMVDPKSISISTNSGRLMLTGKVPSLESKELVRQIIADVHGVSAIDNNLTVVGERLDRSDSEIADQIRFIIGHNPAFQGLDIGVNVRSGSVGLNGEVGSSGEIGRLTRLARVEGVTAFRTSGLSVNRDLAMEAFEDKNYSREQALNAFAAAMRADNRVNPESIQANIQDKVMTLSGSVEKLAARDSAEFSARATPGVLTVVNNLNVSPQGQLFSTVTAASAPLVLPPH